MPASTFEILSSSWEKEEAILNSFSVIASKIGAKLYRGDDIQLHKNYGNKEDAVLIFDINDEKTLEWYYKEYPGAQHELDENIPYFVFIKEISQNKLYSIVSANCYLDDRLIFDFSLEYLKLHPSHYIYINRERYFNLSMIEKINSTKGYYSGWMHK